MITVENDAGQIQAKLQALDRTSQVNTTILDSKTKAGVNICVTFDATAREATPEEFKTLKIFALEEGYDFREEVDMHPEGYKMCYYILTLGSTPF